MSSLIHASVGYSIEVDTIKSRVQTSSFSTREIIRDTLRLEGWRAFYRGVGPVVVGGVPGVCLYLTTYEYVKETLSRSTHVSPFLVYMTSALTAETICCIIFVPVDVVKERMQVTRDSTSAKHPYTSSFQALRHILQTEGIRGIYKGYGATLASYGPFACIYFVLYEELKTAWAKATKIDPHDILFSEALVA